MQYLFTFGRTPKISLAELTSLLVAYKISYKITDFSGTFCVILVENDQAFHAPTLMHRLGGTLQIASEIDTQESNTENAIVSDILDNQTTGKIVFSVSGPQSKQIGLRIKKQLKQEGGRSVRFVEPKSMASLIHNDVVAKQSHYTLHQKQIFKIRAIAPLEELVNRDHARRHNAKRGMLPPKLAQILINLTGALPDKDYIYDPFCGSGTILTESLAMGFTKIAGTDVSEHAIRDTEINIEAIIAHEQIKKKISVHLAKTNVTEIAQTFTEKVTAIATEPFMGKPLQGDETRAILTTQARELGELYTKSFRNFASILKPGNTIVFIFPKFVSGAEQVSTATYAVPNIVSSGQFKTVPLLKDAESLEYTRKDQHLIREIWKFERI